MLYQYFLSAKIRKANNIKDANEKKCDSLENHRLFMAK